MHVHDDTRYCGAPWSAYPGLFGSRIGRLPSDSTCTTAEAEPNGRGSFRVMRPSRITGCHAPIHFSWPTPGQRPPHDVQKKALAEPVVAGEKVQSRREIERHLRRWSDVVKLQVLDHRFPPASGPVSTAARARMRCYGSRGVATLASGTIHRRRHAVRNHRSPRYPGFNVLAWTSDLHQQIERSRPQENLRSSNLVLAVSTHQDGRRDGEGAGVSGPREVCRHRASSAGSGPGTVVPNRRR